MMQAVRFFSSVSASDTCAASKDGIDLKCIHRITYLAQHAWGAVDGDEHNESKRHKENIQKELGEVLPNELARAPSLVTVAPVWEPGVLYTWLHLF